MATINKKFNFVPLGDRVLVRPSEKEGEKKLASGIIIPEAANKEKLYKGEVVVVGAGRRNEKGERIPLEVKAGDAVFFKKPWDEPIKLDGVEYYVLSESDILLVTSDKG
jgi:chaperonin GroES